MQILEMQRDLGLKYGRVNPLQNNHQSAKTLNRNMLKENQAIEEGLYGHRPEYSNVKLPTLPESHQHHTIDASAGFRSKSVDPYRKKKGILQESGLSPALKQKKLRAEAQARGKALRQFENYADMKQAHQDMMEAEAKELEDNI